MLIEESKITQKPPRLAEIVPKRSGSFVKQPVKMDRRLQDSGRQRSKLSYSSRATRRAPLSLISPRTQDTAESYPRSVDISRLDDISEIPPVQERKRRRGRRDKLADVYQDRAFSKLLAELRA